MGSIDRASVGQARPHGITGVSAADIVRFTIPLPAAHAFVSAMIVTTVDPVNLEEQCFEFEDTSATNETRIGCSVAVGFFGDKSN